MATKQELRSEQTKRSILAAAGALFAERGFDAVTMREIAKKAGCSHTTIYIYFTDKEALLHQLAMPPLLQLREEFRNIFQAEDNPPEHNLRQICLAFIRFCLTNRNMHDIFFNVNSVRVDEAQPKLELNKVRNELFGMLTKALQACLRIDRSDERLLAYSRIAYYTLYGIVGTYTHSSESADELLARLTPTFRDAFEALLIGFTHKMKEEGVGGK